MENIDSQQLQIPFDFKDISKPQIDIPNRDICDTLKITRPNENVSFKDDNFSPKVKDISINITFKTKKRNNKKLDKTGRIILLNWLFENKDFPYPTKEEYERLCKQTGFQKSQISTFFVNNRMRYLKRNPKNGTTNQKIEITI